ncbi:MAG TPA: winged helix-turn-helix domain-containing protein [Bryobacteraceae bacterium]|nr:winged helix-turn-helix domain-containing protein [Bryobacteraceae bacterium]
MNGDRRGHVRFGPFDLNLETGELRKNDIKVIIQIQPFEVLAALLERPGELVTREELKERIWGHDTYVDFDQGLNRSIKKIRAALSDSAEIPKYIETLPKRGYRFVAPASADVDASGVFRSFPEAERSPTTPIPPAAVDSASVRMVRKRGAPLAAWTGGVLVVVGVLCFLVIYRGPPRTTQGTLRQLTMNAAENSIVNALISPDGNYLLYGDLTGIHLRPIATQETRTFGRPAGISAEDGWYPVSWFPDQARFVAVALQSTRQGLKVSSWIVSVLGGGITLLREDAVAKSVSPDGLEVAYTAGGPTSDQEIWVTWANGEDARRLAAIKSFGAFNDLQWAPDSRHLADAGLRVNNAGQVEFFLESRDPKGSSPAVLVTQPNLVGSLGWFSDSTISYVEYSDPSEPDGGPVVSEIKVELQTARRAGRPRRSMKWPAVNISHISSSRDGKRMVYCKRSSRVDIYIGELDSKGGLHGSRRLTLEDSNSNPWAWTPDSRAVLFTSNRGGSWAIYKQGIDETVAEPIVTGSKTPIEPRVSPDGRSILYLVDEDSSGRSEKLMRIPLSGGPPRQIMAFDGSADVQCARAPATHCMLAKVGNQPQMTVALLDPEDGSTRDSFRRTLGFSFCGGEAISPDGSEIAVMRSDFRKAEIDLYSSSGPLKQNIEVKGWNRLGGLDYSADGKAFYTGFIGAMYASLLRIDRSGRVEVLVRRRGTGVGTWAIPSPDGRYLAMRTDSSGDNAWMMDGS